MPSTVVLLTRLLFSKSAGDNTADGEVKRDTLDSVDKTGKEEEELETNDTEKETEKGNERGEELSSWRYAKMML